MQTEPPIADLPNRRRRWFQFRLRTLLMGVTLLAILKVIPLGWVTSAGGSLNLDTLLAAKAMIEKVGD